MAVGTLAEFDVVFDGVERRRHKRLRVALSGRCMLQDRREFVCRVIDVSLGGLALAIPAVARIGERVVTYLDEIGRFEGRVARLIDGGLALTLDLTRHGRGKLTRLLARLGGEAVVSDRRHERRLLDDFVSVLRMVDGSTVECRVLDLSVSGAAVGFSGARPPLGSPVRLGSTVGRVARVFDRGIAIAFEAPCDDAEGSMARDFFGPLGRAQSEAAPVHREVRMHPG